MRRIKIRLRLVIKDADERGIGMGRFLESLRNVLHQVIAICRYDRRQSRVKLREITGTLSDLLFEVLVIGHRPVDMQRGSQDLRERPVIGP